MHKIPTAAPVYYVGDTVVSGTIEFTVVGIESQTRLGGESDGIETPNRFVVVRLRVYNLGKQKTDLLNTCFTLICGEKSLNLHSGSSMLLNGFYVLQTLCGEQERFFALAFEIPTNTEEICTLQVKGNALAAKKSIVLMDKPESHEPFLPLAKVAPKFL